MNDTRSDRSGPFARLRQHFRDSVAAAKEAGRRERERQIVEHGQARVDRDTPPTLKQWLGSDRSPQRSTAAEEMLQRVASGRAAVAAEQQRRRDYEERVIARAVELGYTDTWLFRDSDNVHPPEWYEDNRVRLLGEMPDLTWGDPETAIAARARDQAAQDAAADGWPPASKP